MCFFHHLHICRSKSIVCVHFTIDNKSVTIKCNIPLLSMMCHIVGINSRSNYCSIMTMWCWQLFGSICIPNWCFFYLIITEASLMFCKCSKQQVLTSLCLDFTKLVIRYAWTTLPWTIYTPIKKRYNPWAFVGLWLAIAMTFFKFLFRLWLANQVGSSLHDRQFATNDDNFLSCCPLHSIDGMFCSLSLFRLHLCQTNLINCAIPPYILLLIFRL